MISPKLLQLGLTERFAQAAMHYEGLFLARVTVQRKEIYEVVTECGLCQAEVSGKLAFLATGPADYPVVGDWVMLDRTDDFAGNAIIHHILSRSSLIERKAAGVSHQSQPIAANINTVFICMSLNANFNLRRLERYLAIAWDSKATPVVVLTKADLCPDVEARLSAVYAVAIGVDVLVTTSLSEEGYRVVSEYIKEGETVAFLGSSGVGKSTLINRLAGKNILATQEIGQTDKGRHTTTSRQLIALPSGGIVVDTPGMRELQLESADLAQSFADIEELARKCRFSDCAHQTEPGCAIREAITNKRLSAERLRSFQKLQAELGYQGLTSRQLETEKINRMVGSKGAWKQMRLSAKEKNKRR